MSTVYVVHMCRYGSNELHSYVSGAYTSLKRALEEGLSHSLYRAGKYEPTVYRVGVDDSGTQRTLCDSVDSAQELYEQMTGQKWVETTE